MIPTIVDYLGLTTVDLGVVLLLGGIGAMVGIPIVTNLIFSGGSAQSILSGVFAVSCFLPIAGFSWFGFSTVGLSVGVFGVGTASAIYDVANNSHAVTLEKLLGKNIIGSLQATNSFGNLCGVLTGGICGANRIPTFVFFIVVGAVGSTISMLFYQFLVDVDTEKGLAVLPLDRDLSQNQGPVQGQMTVFAEEVVAGTSSSLCLSTKNTATENSIHSVPSSVEWTSVLAHSKSCQAKSFDELLPPPHTWPGEGGNAMRVDSGDSRISTVHNRNRLAEESDFYGWNKRLAGLCFMGFMNFLGVGSVNNWSTVYFSYVLDTSPFFTTLGYAFFELFVMTGQISSDFFVMRFGPKNVLVCSGILAFIGISTVVYAPSNPFMEPGATCQVSDSCTVVGIIGYAITGMGFSSIGPILISQTVSLNL
jgi:MFS family permease